MVKCLKSVLVTGSDGFIGKNLVVRLSEQENVNVYSFTRNNSVDELPDLVSKSDAIIHLAGENRPADERAYEQVNLTLTSLLCDAIKMEFQTKGRHVPLVLASSTQALCDSPYGRSKHAAENAARLLSKATGNPCIIFRLPGVFGKWCRPNYNSVIATFCHNIARDMPIWVSDPLISLRLVYVDDVVDAFLEALKDPVSGCIQAYVKEVYTIRLGEIANQIRSFKDSRSNLLSDRVGIGFTRALYSTYLSYLPKDKFSYAIPEYADERGVFVEMLKTPDCGQISYFTAHPGVTRGGHYHHTKTEKFLVIKGKARFRFRNMITNELVELNTCGTNPEVVDTIPGWVHEITNIGSDDMFVILWANENFDRKNPDTVTAMV